MDDPIKEGLEQCDMIDKYFTKMYEQSIAYAEGKHESLGNIESTWREYKKSLKRVRKAAEKVKAQSGGK